VSRVLVESVWFPSSILMIPFNCQLT
jgi:hypothetical protein